MQLTPEELLIGASITFDVVIPPSILQPGGSQSSESEEREMVVQLRPLTIGTFQLIMKAARNDAALIPLLMIKESLVQPILSLEQVKQLHLGLVNYLIQHIREISGLTGKKNSISGLKSSPLVQAAYIFAREFGWTPQQVQVMTMAQISVYMEMLTEESRSRDERGINRSR